MKTKKIKENKEKILRSKPELIVMWLLVIVFLLYSVSLIFPFYWIFINSFKTLQNFITDIWSFPKPLTFENWLNAFKLTVPNSELKLPGLFGNTLFFVVMNVGISMFFNCLSAYVVAKYNYKIMDTIHSVALILLIVPQFGSLAAMYRFYVDSGLYNTYTGVILLSLNFFSASFLFLHAFFRNLSWEYAEAAFIDGAGHWQVFLRIMMPMSIPIIGALGILSVIGTWNDYFTVFMYAPEKATIGVGLHALSGNIRGQYPSLFAAMVMSLIPIIIVFIIFNKTIMENVSFGGVKG